MAIKKVLVVGGGGFIGRWLVDRFLKEGFRVAVYDNFRVGRLQNLAAFRGQIELFEADILDPEKLQAALKKVSPTIVVHLAALHYIPFCDEHPAETLSVNALGTHEVLSAALRVGVETAVVASSGALYRSAEEPLREDHETPAPCDIYGLSKLLTENVAEYFAATTAIRCVVARLFNTYGPYETNPHLIPHIVESLRQGPRIELGNIHSKRDYVYVEDVAAALFRCSQIDGQRYTVVNIGTGVEYSAQEIVEEISKVLGKPIEIVVGSERLRSQDKLHQIADVGKLRELAGYQCEHTLRDGLKKLLGHEGLV